MAVYSGNRVPYFSNPSVLYDGRQTGSIGANNALTLDQTADVIANFRCHIGCSTSFSDLDNTGVVDTQDLLIVIVDWECTGVCSGDANQDGIVNIQDLIQLITDWGPCDFNPPLEIPLEAGELIKKRLGISIFNQLKDAYRNQIE